MEWNIADLIERIVDLAPDREALVCGNARRSYAQLEERANRLANHLASAGIGPGDHVGIYAFNCVEFVESMLGAYKLRAVPINVNYRYVEDELRYLFDNADLEALVHHRRFTPRLSAVKGEMPLLRHLIAIDDDSGEDFRAIGAVAYPEARAGASPARSFDPRWGERVAAVVQPRPGHTPTLDAPASHCRDKIAGYKIPRALYLVERIERSPSGKPDYPWAKALAAERAARE